MSSKLMLAIMAVLLGANTMAQAVAGPGDFCGGLKIGNVSGFTGKLWLKQKYAVDFTIGSLGLGNMEVDASFLFNQFGLFKSERDDLNEKVEVYFGGGALAVADFYNDSTIHVGAKATAGMAYIFPEPFEIYAEVSPTVLFTSSTQFGFLGGIGARYYFTQGK